MLKSEQILNAINSKMEEIKNLSGDEKVTVYNEIMILKKDYEIEKSLEKEEIENLENKITEGEVITMEKRNEIELLNKEEKVFADYVRTAIANGMTAGQNAPLIPSTISARIIEKVEEVSPLYARATKFNVNGALTFVKESAIPDTAYMDEFEDVSETNATFTTVKLEGFVARALAKVSRSLINKTDFDIVSYVVNSIAKSIAKFLEKELIVGTNNKIEGLSDIGAESVTTFNADALVDLQMEVPSALQAGCEWLMNPSDLKKVRKFKTTDGQYLLNADATAEFGYRVLGKNVMISDQVPAGKVFYGDFSGIYVKLENDIEISVLKERYAEQYAVGVVGFIQVDAKVVEDQKIKSIIVSE